MFQRMSLRLHANIQMLHVQKQGANIVQLNAGKTVIGGLTE